jgi:HD-GYP domain-containing protein (c-di-GMP phosphodiesterase class II)
MGYYVVTGTQGTDYLRMVDVPAFVRQIPLKSLAPDALTNRDNLLVDVDLGNVSLAGRLKATLPSNPFLVSRVFVCDRGRAVQETQAVVFGATRLISRPIDPKAIDDLFRQWSEEVSAAAKAKASRVHANVANATPQARAMTAGRSVVDGVMTALRQGGTVNTAEVVQAASWMIEGMSASKLSAWLGAVKSNHEGTYRRMLVVAGPCASTGRELGLPTDQHSSLVVAGLLHDVGTARIPTAILDRIESLSPAEQEIYARHPQIGHDFLKERSSIGPEVLEAVLRHHEALDGSGFPGRLDASSLSQVSRALAVISGFVWKTEAVGYRPGRTPAEALQLLAEAGKAGKYDQDVIAALARVI